MNISFKRITSSGNFIPAIDGLRFVAILSVVLFHFHCFFSIKDNNVYTDTIDITFLTNLMKNGDFGVPLFFIISGFILGKPFAEYFFKLKPTAVNLKRYYWRRVTRLEPPYFLVMTVMLFGAVYVAKILPFYDAFLSYLASITYTHNFFYGAGRISFLNPVSWSLEIEIQFYILAPLFVYLFAINKATIRRLILIISCLLFSLFDYCIQMPFWSLLNYVEYFLVGFLLLDLYLSKCTFLPKTKFDNFFTFLLLLFIFLFKKESFETPSFQLLWEVLQLIGAFLFCYYVLLHDTFKSLSKPLITNIGGMCYSIYLIHYPLISLVGNPLLDIQFSTILLVNIGIYSLILIIAIMFVSSTFFLLVERPFMKMNRNKESLVNER